MTQQEKRSELLFTFHYGPIQMVTGYGRHLEQANLHSTMVLFKFGMTANDAFDLIASFTFHYGPIQIDNLAFFPVIKYSFTFHYGPIQI